MAASTALPPRFMTSTPTCEAMRSVEATIPRRARTGVRDAARAAPAPGPAHGSGAAGETKNSRTSSSRKKICLAVMVFALAFVGRGSAQAQLHVERAADGVEAVRLYLAEAERAIHRDGGTHAGERVEPHPVVAHLDGLADDGFGELAAEPRPPEGRPHVEP